MGAAASSKKPQEKYQPEQSVSVSPPALAGHDRGSVKLYTGSQRLSTRSVKSIRGMAMMNHARHENTYIPAETLSIRLKGTNDIETGIPFEHKHEQITPIRESDGPNPEEGEQTRSEIPRVSSIHIPPTPKTPKAPQSMFSGFSAPKTPKTPKTPHTPTNMNYSSQSTVNSVDSGPPPLREMPTLSRFKSNMTLKLNIEDDDWNHVSDDDEDDDLNLFNKRLIEIPRDSDKDSQVAKDSIATLTPNKNTTSTPKDSNKNTTTSTPKDSNKNSKESSEKSTVSATSYVPPPLLKAASAQFNNKGTINVEEAGMVVGKEGIIRKNKTGPVSSKLPIHERLIILCKLGAGASSAVYKALDLVDCKLVALKTMQVYEKEKRFQMIRELTSLFQLLRENSRRSSNHMPSRSIRSDKFIVDFYDAFTNPEDGVVSLMIEYMDGGSLQDIVDQGGCDDESTLANISIQALKGLSLLHDSYQLHRDIKPANFLISHRGEVKVADLGILKQLNQPTPNTKMHGGLPRTNTFVGTATYMSPERIDGKEYSFPSDIWAFGLSIMSLALGKLPIDTKGGYWTILHGIRDAPPPQLSPEQFPPDLCDFVNSCMKRNPDERPTCKQLLRHPFLNKALPEDLTINDDPEQAKEEVQSIFRAMLVHINKVRYDLKTRYGDDSQKYFLESSPIHQKIFGNILESKNNEVVRRLLFNAPASRADGANRLVRSRLALLAKQVHLPLDVVTEEAKMFCDELDHEFQSRTQAATPSSDVPANQSEPPNQGILTQ